MPALPMINALSCAVDASKNAPELMHILRTIDHNFLDQKSNTYPPEVARLVENLQKKLVLLASAPSPPVSQQNTHAIYETPQKHARWNPNISSSSFISPHVSQNPAYDAHSHPSEFAPSSRASDARVLPRTTPGTYPVPATLTDRPSQSGTGRGRSRSRSQPQSHPPSAHTPMSGLTAQATGPPTQPVRDDVAGTLLAAMKRIDRRMQLLDQRTRNNATVNKLPSQISSQLSTHTPVHAHVHAPAYAGMSELPFAESNRLSPLPSPRDNSSRLSGDADVYVPTSKPSKFHSCCASSSPSRSPPRSPPRTSPRISASPSSSPRKKSYVLDSQGTISELRQRLSVAEEEAASLRNVLMDVGDRNRERLFPLLQEREELRQRLQLQTAALAAAEAEQAKLAADVKKMRARARDPLVQLVPVSVADDETPQQLQRKRAELRETRSKLLSVTTTREEMVSLIEELYDDCEELLDEQQETTERYSVLQGQLAEAATRAAAAEMDAREVRRSAGEREVELLGRLAVAQGRAREAEAALEIAGKRGERGQMLSEGQAGIISTLRATLAKVGEEMERERAATEKERRERVARETEIVELKRELALERAKIGKGSLRHACAKYMAQWYRDKYRVLTATVYGNGYGKRGVTKEGLGECFNGCHEAVSELLSQIRDLRAELESGKDKFALYPELLRKHIEFREEMRKKEGTLHTRSEEIEKALARAKAAEEEVRVLKARQALLAREQRLGGVASGLNAGSQALMISDVRKKAEELLLSRCLSSFQGDYIGVRALQGVQAAVLARGDKEVLFADTMVMVGRNNTHEPRTIVVTERSLFLFKKPDSAQPEAMVQLASLAHVSMSRMVADVVVLHHSLKHDMLLITPKRLELVHVLCTQYLHIKSKALPVQFCERLYICDDGVHSREVLIGVREPL